MSPTRPTANFYLCFHCIGSLAYIYNYLFQSKIITSICTVSTDTNRGVNEVNHVAIQSATTSSSTTATGPPIIQPVTYFCNNNFYTNHYICKTMQTNDSLGNSLHTHPNKKNITAPEPFLDFNVCGLQ